MLQATTIFITFAHGLALGVLFDDYDRYECVTCLQKQDTAKCSKTDCIKYTSTYQTAADCPSNCEECLNTPNKVFTPLGCQDQCLQDTWCYTSQESCSNVPSLCSTCLDFGFYFKIREGCVSLCDEAADDCVSPIEDCPSLQGIGDCDECVANGGAFTGSECLQSCVYFLPCITQCS